MKAAFAAQLLALPAAPCLWESDTFNTELRGLPDAFDLVVGRWHRHGDAMQSGFSGLLEPKTIPLVFPKSK